MIPGWNSQLEISLGWWTINTGGNLGHGAHRITSRYLAPHWANDLRWCFFLFHSMSAKKGFMTLSYRCAISQLLGSNSQTCILGLPHCEHWLTEFVYERNCRKPLYLLVKNRKQTWFPLTSSIFAGNYGYGFWVVSTPSSSIVMEYEID